MFSSEAWLANPGADFYNGVATQSLRFDDGSNAYLSRTPSSAGNRKTWTWSCWLKLGDFTTTRRLFMATQGANINSTGDMSFVFLTSGKLLFQQNERIIILRNIAGVQCCLVIFCIIIGQARL